MRKRYACCWGSASTQRSTRRAFQRLHGHPHAINGAVVWSADEEEGQPGTPIEIWFQEEARIGQKNGLVYQWAEPGSRPRQARDQRYEYCLYLSGAIGPARDVGAALILPHDWAMQQHLGEISRRVATGALPVVLLDQAGWHTTDKLNEPANIRLLPPPPKSPSSMQRRTSGSNCVFATRPFSTPASKLGAASLPRTDASPPWALATGP
jgi:hypothetical protein